MNNWIFMEFIWESHGQCFLQLDSAHNLEKDMIVNCILHSWQESDLHWLLHVAQHHLSRNNLVVFAYVLISNEDLLNCH
jgi:hypothetical protein